MDRELYLKISKWRDETAHRDHVEPYRVISTQALEGISTSQPRTKEELLLVKGIAEKKFSKYGVEILALVAGETARTSLGRKQSSDLEREPQRNDSQIFSVSDFLELINIGLRSSKAKVKGEISSLDIRDRYLFFGLKDSEDGALLNCMMWRNDYELSGIALEEGMEVAVTGYPEVYKPLGRLSFQGKSVELVGEGALKKAYDELKKKLEAEGIFSEKRKKALPLYPETIGVISSKTGAVIHDFLNNLGKFGYKIKFCDSRVEGQLAVRELAAGVRYFKKYKKIDVLVIMRGGGSLESLQAFNNETLVREISDCSFPIIAGIGHDKDVPLISLAADVMVSTPTAATRVINRPWEEAITALKFSQERMLSSFKSFIGEREHTLTKYSSVLARGVNQILEHVGDLTRVFERIAERLAFGIERTGQKISEHVKTISLAFSSALIEKEKRIDEMTRTLRMNSPKRQLELGYSIVSSNGKVIRSVNDTTEGQHLDITISDGKIGATVDNHNDGK